MADFHFDRELKEVVYMDIISHGNGPKKVLIKTWCPYCGCCFQFDLNGEAQYMRWAVTDINIYSKDLAAYYIGFHYIVRCPDCKDKFYVSGDGKAMGEYDEVVIDEREKAIKLYNEYLKAKNECDSELDKEMVERKYKEFLKRKYQP